MCRVEIGVGDGIEPAASGATVGKRDCGDVGPFRIIAVFRVNSHWLALVRGGPFRAQSFKFLSSGADRCYTLSDTLLQHIAVFGFLDDGLHVLFE